MTDFDYMVESVTADLVVLLMERLGMDLQTALDTVYTSDTFAKFPTRLRSCIIKVHIIFTLISKPK